MNRWVFIKIVFNKCPYSLLIRSYVISTNGDRLDVFGVERGKFRESEELTTSTAENDSSSRDESNNTDTTSSQNVVFGRRTVINKYDSPYRPRRNVDFSLEQALENYNKHEPPPTFNGKNWIYNYFFPYNYHFLIK